MIVQKVGFFLFLYFICCVSQIEWFTSNYSQIGEGTYAGIITSNDCSIQTNRPEWNTLVPVFIATTQFYNSASCGTCIEVNPLGTGVGQTPVTFFRGFIVGSCPTCQPNSIDIAQTGDGRWDIAWKAVPCPVTRPVTYLLEGSNPFYLRIQPTPTRVPLASMAVIFNNVAQNLTLQSGFYVGQDNSGRFVAPLKVQLTSIFGEVFQDTVATLTNGQFNEGQGLQFNTTALTTGQNQVTTGQNQVTTGQNQVTTGQNQGTTGQSQGATGQGQTVTTQKNDNLSGQSRLEMNFFQFFFLFFFAFFLL